MVDAEKTSREGCGQLLQDALLKIHKRERESFWAKEKYLQRWEVHKHLKDEGPELVTIEGMGRAGGGEGKSRLLFGRQSSSA